jgi:PhnB protein
MANTVRAIPEGYHTITPALTCRDAAKAIDFYKKALGAKEINRMEGPDGKIGHAELQIGDSKFMLSDEYPQMASAPDPNSKSAPSSYLFIYSSDVDNDFNKAVSAGCKVTMPLQNQFWGDRYGRLTDPFGHHWGLAQHVEDVAPAEMERRAKEWQEKMAKSAGGHN